MWFVWSETAKQGSYSLQQTIQLRRLKLENICITESTQNWAGTIKLQYWNSAEQNISYLVLSWDLSRWVVDHFRYTCTVCRIEENFHSRFLHCMQKGWRYTSVSFCKDVQLALIKTCYAIMQDVVKASSMFRSVTVRFTGDHLRHFCMHWRSERRWYAVGSTKPVCRSPTKLVNLLQLLRLYGDGRSIQKSRNNCKIMSIVQARIPAEALSTTW